MAHASGSARHTRPQPKEWGALLEVSRTTVETHGTGLPRSAGAGHAMLEQLSPMHNQRLMANMQYGYGAIACHFAQSVMARRAEVVQNLGGIYAQRAGGQPVTADGVLFYMGRHLGEGGTTIIHDLASQAHAALSGEQWLLVDSLQLARDLRVTQRKDRAGKLPANTTLAQTKQKDWANFSTGRRAADVLAGEGLMTPAVIARMALRRGHDVLTGGGGEYDPENKPNTTSAAEIIAAGGFDHLAVKKVSLRAARMRFDWFRFLGQSLDMEGGVFSIHPEIAERLAQEAPEDPGTIHAEIENCPALNVVSEFEGEVASLIPLMGEIILDSIAYGDTHPIPAPSTVQ